MSGKLLTAADLGEELGASAAKVMEWRRTYGWPHVRIGRSIRWTPEQVEQITKAHTVIGGPESPVIVPADGRTARSARRSA